MKIIIVSLMTAIILSATILAGCSCDSTEEADSYMAVIPAVLHGNSTESMSVSMFSGGKPVKDNVEITLLRDGNEIQKIRQTVDGKQTIAIPVPDLAEGTYQINVKGPGFDDTADVTVENSFLVFLETDKPIYKPGQTIHIRAITLDADLKPVPGTVTIEALDAKGIKIFRQEAESDVYGLVSVDLPLSDEPNLGVWKLRAVTTKGETQTDVRVEEYVLPKYEVNADLSKDWYLVNEKISGTISAEYSFGKPVSGDFEVKASRYVGEWEVYQTYSGKIDGDATFTIGAPGYVAGVPASGGQGNVMLEISVTEQSTGYTERTSSLLTVTDSPVNILIIPESTAFKPGLVTSMLVITETPDNKPVDAELNLELSYLDSDYGEISHDSKTIKTEKGKTIIRTLAPEKAVAMTVYARYNDANTYAHEEIELVASYSPSGNFIQLEQTSEGVPAIGETIEFTVHSTKEAVNFYYEIVSRGRVVYSDYTNSDTIKITTTPQMTPSARLLVYQILPNSEVAADYLPFDVEAAYPHQVTAEFNTDEAAPGDEVTIEIKADGESRFGIAAVDKSVFILAENRLNLQQVFDELERLYMVPQVELHEVSIYPSITTRGAFDVFDDSGMIVLSNNDLPEGETYKSDIDKMAGGGIVFMAVDDVAEEEAMAPVVVEQSPSSGDGGLAEVERVRQFFPETWLWDDLMTNPDGSMEITAPVPDSITTWMLRVVALSREHGLGVAEDSLVVFQPFFTTIDLPYSAIRGEEFPVSVAIYNYLDSEQEVTVDIEESDWFELIDSSRKIVKVGAGEVGGVDFMVRVKDIGINDVRITARSREAADAIIKTIIVEPEGVGREVVQNITLTPGLEQTIETMLPFNTVADSERAYLAITGSYLTQTIDGLEGLIQMPFGCGEQNMIVFAPDVYITKYLKQSGQLKPEIMAKAEKLMITGYQRELTYRHSDGSFSAFGESDESGSLWLTAFVLKSFAQAKDLMYIDPDVLSEASDWIISHQNSDGSFDQVGFLHHQELLGGLQGKEALTAYTAIALLEAGKTNAANKAVSYLEEQLDGIDGAYGLAITAYALELAGSPKAGDAYAMLMATAIEDENGLHWSNGDSVQPLLEEPGRIFVPDNRTADIEITGYAMMAISQHGDALNASRAAKWLTTQRNAYGGYGSTQDTVVALQALTEFAASASSDVDLVVTITAGDETDKVVVYHKNFDVLQIVEIPVNEIVTISVTGEGEAIAQAVTRYNLPEVVSPYDEEVLAVEVDYDTTNVAVNDLISISASVTFNPPEYMEAGMVVLDVSVPTGFAPVAETIAEVVESNDNIKRYEIAGRKVIFYIENMYPGDTVSLEFAAKALYPVKAKAVSSQAYSYYQPDIKGETLGEEVTVTD